MTRIDADSEPVDVADGSGDSADELMARARPEAPVGAPLARARVLGAMFGQQSAGGAIGRFRVLERLGAGGMGVVYEAYDPDLARGVALKLVNVSARDRQAALAEAKALARLSHPNVVPIYDVGLERDRVYLVMELVRGDTLRRWPDGRKLREILDVYQQAGRALAAAHDVGLVHRDFKPDNAIVGTDGRVRVVDFGLACEADAPASATSGPRDAAGTPRFMAPEIKAGTATTPAADQYSFCVALADAVERAREPTPGRIAAVLGRGRAADPTERFASMDDLLRALARDPARTRRRLAAVGGLAASVGALAFFLGRHSPSEAADPCGGGAAKLAAIWSPVARVGDLGRLATLDAYGPSLQPLLARTLDGHAGRWTHEYQAACFDRRNKLETDTMSERRTTCLERSSEALATVRELVRSAEPATLVQLPLAVQALPDPASCSDRKALVSDIDPPPAALAISVSHVQRQITQVEIHLAAGLYEQALAEIRSAVVAARELGYAPALAEALVLQGNVQMKVDPSAAVPILDEAIKVANWSHARALGIEAWARRAYAQGVSDDPEGAVAGLDFVESEAQGTPSAAFALALLYNNVGSVALGKGDQATARAYLEQALTTSRMVTGHGALELLAIRANFALVTEDRRRGDKLLAEVATERADRLGADHPETLNVREQRGFVTIENLREAEALLTSVCRAYELHETLAEDAAECWQEIGLLRWDLDEEAGARDAMSRVVHGVSNTAEATAYLALLQGDWQAAAQRFSDAVSSIPPQATKLAWVRADRAVLTLGLGRARRALGDFHGAREALESTIADLEPFVRDHPGARRERRLGRARVELAFTLAAMGAPLSERTTVAAAAVAWLRHVGGPDAEIARLKRLTL